MPEERFAVKGAFPLVGLGPKTRLAATECGRGDCLGCRAVAVAGTW